MQTFLPYDDFYQSAKVLDWRRLGKQRVEAKQILNALERGSGGWLNHPATKMWKGHEAALQVYHDVMVQEWIRRGYNNTMKLFNTTATEYPTWFGDPVFHASHRSNLLRKDPEWYRQWGWDESDDLPYVWPVKQL